MPAQPTPEPDTTPTVEQIRESARIAADADTVHAVSTTAVMYAVEEYLSYSEKWVTAYGGFDTVERAQYEYDRYVEKFGSAENFRVTETTFVTTVTVIN